MILSIESSYLAVFLDVELAISYIYMCIWALTCTYYFDVLLELETIDPMATVLATHQLMAIEKLTFQKEP